MASEMANWVELKEAGSEALRDGNHDDAIAFYTKALESLLEEERERVRVNESGRLLPPPVPPHDHIERERDVASEFLDGIASSVSVKDCSAFAVLYADKQDRRGCDYSFSWWLCIEDGRGVM